MAVGGPNPYFAHREGRLMLHLNMPLGYQIIIQMPGSERVDEVNLMCLFVFCIFWGMMERSLR